MADRAEGKGHSRACRAAVAAEGLAAKETMQEWRKLPGLATGAPPHPLHTHTPPSLSGTS